MRAGLTRKQQELLAYIKRYIFEHEGMSPSFEEMKDALGLASTSGIHRIVNALEERGFIRRLENKARSIAIGVASDLAEFDTGALLDELTARGFDVSINERLAA